MGDLQNLLWLLIHAGIKMEHYVGKKTPTSCASFGSWKAQNMRKMLILGKCKQHDTLHYGEL